MRKPNLNDSEGKSAKELADECCPCCKKSWVSFRDLISR